MISGPKPKPAALKKLTGRSHHKQNPDEPKPERPSAVPPAPRWLGPVAKGLWRKMAKDLWELGVLTEIDLDALARYCVCWERWRKAERIIKEQGEIVKTPNGYSAQNPYLAIANKCLKQLDSLGAEFGCTPSTRTRVSVVPTHKLNALEESLFGKPVRVGRAATRSRK
jgi:P27 family predicted phage terminase small subunit